MAWVRVREKATGKQKVISSGVASMLKDKYEIIESGVEEQSSEVTETVQTPNLMAAAEKTADANEDGVELANARAEYETLFGEKPHGRLKLASILKLNLEKRGQA